MTFYSTAFLLFFVVLFAIYYFLLKGRAKAQNALLLVASGVFYGYASLKTLPLMAVIVAVYYFLGIGIGKATKERTSSLLSTLGVVLGVGILLYF